MIQRSATSNLYKTNAHTHTDYKAFYSFLYFKEKANRHAHTSNWLNSKRKASSEEERNIKFILHRISTKTVLRNIIFIIEKNEELLSEE